MVNHGRRVSVIMAAAVVALVLTACSRSATVELSSDWSHLIGYTNVSVDDRMLVVGIDPAAGEARALADVPTPPDGNPVESGPVSRNGAGQTVVVQPTDSGAGVAYRVDRGSATATEVASLPGGGPLYPRRGGWADTASKQGVTQVTLRDSAFAATGTFRISAPSELGATDGGHLLCLAGRAGHRYVVTTIDLTTHGTVASAHVSAKPDDVACIDGHPLIAYARPGLAAPGVTRLASGASAAALRGEVVDAIVVDGHTAIAVVDSQETTALELIAPRSGKVTELATVPGIAVVDAFLSGRTLVLIGDGRAVTFDLRTHESRSFPLPGSRDAG